MKHTFTTGERDTNTALCAKLVNNLLNLSEWQKDGIVLGDIAMNATLGTGLRNVDLEFEKGRMLREIVLKHILRNRAFRHFLRTDPMRVHSLWIRHVIRKELFLLVQFGWRITNQNDLFSNERSEESVKIMRDFVSRHTSINGTNVVDDCIVFMWLPRDPAEKHLRVGKHLVVGLDPPQHIRERPVLPDEGILRKSHQHFILPRKLYE